MFYCFKLNQGLYLVDSELTNSVVLTDMCISDRIRGKAPLVVFPRIGIVDYPVTVRHKDTEILKRAGTRGNVGFMPNTAMDYIVTDGFYHYDKRQRAKAYYEPLISVFSDSNIEIKYNGDWKCRVGKTIFAHPLAFSSAMMKTTEKALNFFFRTEQDFDTVVLGHTHQLGYYTQGDVSMFEQGTCSDTGKLDYTNGRLTNPQQKGCLYLVQHKDGSLDIDKTKLIKF